MQREKSDRWVFTTWDNPKVNYMNNKLVQFIVFQKEICPTNNRAHFQGYIEFVKPYSLAYAKSLFKDKGIYLNKALCDAKTNIKYCTKSKCRAPMTSPFSYGIPKPNPELDILDDVFDLNK